MGTILQVVLVIFIVLILNISLVFNNIIENSRSLERIRELDRARLLEITILRYYKETILNDLLFSDEISIDDYFINYTVDDMGVTIILLQQSNKMIHHTVLIWRLISKR